MSWEDYIKAAKGLGFSKSCIINRGNYNIVASSSESHIPALWQDGDKEINENVQLFNDWKSLKDNESPFYFFSKKCQITSHDNKNGNWITAITGEKRDECIVCYQFKKIWFVCYAKLSKETEEGGTKTPKEAFNLIMNLWQPLIDAKM